MDCVSTASTNLHHHPCVRRSLGCHVSCKGKNVWEHSPTQRKDRELSRLNRGHKCEFALPPPLSYQGPTIPVGPSYASPTCHVAPLTGIRVDCVASCHVSAPSTHTCASRRPRALCHVALVPRCISEVVPRATSARPLVPVATSAPAGNKPPFSRF